MSPFPEWRGEKRVGMEIAEGSGIDRALDGKDCGKFKLDPVL